MIGNACEWTVINAAGQIVQQNHVSAQMPTQIITADDLKAGMYYLRLESASHIETLPLFIE